MQKYLVGRKTLIIVVVIAYSTLVFTNAGFAYAYFRGSWGEILNSEFNRRQDMAFALGWSLLPPAWIICPFLSGFYYYGWRLPGT